MPKAKLRAEWMAFIITGAPGLGKAAIIRQLELDGFSVVEEAATDVIAAHAHTSRHGTRVTKYNSKLRTV